jgi:hypothetical protein
VTGPSGNDAKGVLGSLMLAASRHALKRFALKLAMILAFAGLQAATPWGFADALIVLAGGSAFMAVVLARVLRQPMRGGALSYWDEALAFVAIALVASFWWHAPAGLGQPAAPGRTAAQQHFR